MSKTILITGAAKRVGKEMALSFFKKGWNIIIHYNSSIKDAQSLTDVMNAKRKNSAFLIQGNLDNADDVLRIALTKELKRVEWVEVDNLTKSDNKTEKVLTN